MCGGLACVQDVTQVAFHPIHRHMLVSGSEDGLVAVFDTAQGLGEHLGWLGNEYPNFRFRRINMT